MQEMEAKKVDEKKAEIQREEILKALKELHKKSWRTENLATAAVLISVLACLIQVLKMLL